MSAGQVRADPRPLRRGRPADLAALVDLEEAAYDPPRRSSRGILARSLRSPRQQVWVMPGPQPGEVDAALTLWLHPRTVRVYGVAVRPELQGKGVGRLLMAQAEAVAADRGADRIVLECHHDAALRRWYEALGFRVVGERAHYYGPGRAAWRLQRSGPFTA